MSQPFAVDGLSFKTTACNLILVYCDKLLYNVELVVSQLAD